MEWLNEPPAWEETNGTLVVTTGHETDFWRKTHYGYSRHSGHVRHQTVAGDFTATVSFTTNFSELYDQAGLMVVVDEATWLKCGVELTSGCLNAAVVVTNEYSDWSILPIDGMPERVWVRITRLNETLMVDYSRDGESFSIIRLAYLRMPDTVAVGPMCCSPSREGLVVTFNDFVVSPPLRTDDQ